MIRKSRHAGSWYSNDPERLQRELQSWLNNASTSPSTTGFDDYSLRAVIAPHAGYSYSGKTAAFAYRPIIEAVTRISRIFILGPSHHFFIEGCALSRCSEYSTPLGSLIVDQDCCQQLSRNHPTLFRWMSQVCDEDEHSIEMQLPFIFHAAQNSHSSLKIVPILVGQVTPAACSQFASALLPFFQDAGSLFVISSDFCHWGYRFEYTYCPPDCPVDMPLHKQIEKLDLEAINCIENKDPETFRRYLDHTENTICGRYPILIMLELLKLTATDDRIKVRLRYYDQSSRIENHNDSSVSYAAVTIGISS
jgi:AmmeMemoRadiSam system protein B